MSTGQTLPPPASVSALMSRLMGPLARVTDDALRRLDLRLEASANASASTEQGALAAPGVEARAGQSPNTAEPHPSPAQQPEAVARVSPMTPTTPTTPMTRGAPVMSGPALRPSPLALPESDADAASPPPLAAQASGAKPPSAVRADGRSAGLDEPGTTGPTTQAAVARVIGPTVAAATVGATDPPALRTGSASSRPELQGNGLSLEGLRTTDDPLTAPSPAQVTAPSPAQVTAPSPAQVTAPSQAPDSRHAGLPAAPAQAATGLHPAPALTPAGPRVAPLSAAAEVPDLPADAGPGAPPTTGALTLADASRLADRAARYPVRPVRPGAEAEPWADPAPAGAEPTAAAATPAVRSPSAPFATTSPGPAVGLSVTLAGPAMVAATPGLVLRAAVPAGAAGRSHEAAAPQPPSAGALPRELRVVAARVERAMTPVFERATGLTTQLAAQAQAEPTSFVATSDAASASAVAATPQVSNTFNVRIALTGGTAGAAEQRRIEAILADLLRDSARRQGLFE